MRYRLRLVLHKTGRLVSYRLLRFPDFIFGILVVEVVVVAGIWIAEVLRQLTSRQYRCGM